MLGIVFLGVGVLFAAIDSQILYRGWAAYGLDEWDKLSYGTAAASVPWVVIGFPFVWWVLWLRGRWRAILPLAVAGAVYAVLIVYSLIGAMGSIATQRGQVIAGRQEARESVDTLKDQRARYRTELGWIPKHRPPGQVTALLEAERIKRQWQWTDECRDIRTASHRAYCTGVSALAGELAAARKSEDLQRKIGELTQRIDGRAPVGEKADPMAATLASWLGLDEGSTTARLPLATPLVLLIGEMTFVYLGMLLLGIGHRQMVSHGVAGSSDVGKPGEAGRLTLPPPLVTTGEADVGPVLAGQSPPPLRTTLTRQRELAEDFFRRCVRPAPDGQLPEAVWYQHYCDVCERSADQPLPVEAFRRLATHFIPTIREIGGTTYYLHVLPLLPKENAA
jgi:hypothetical protein